MTLFLRARQGDTPSKPESAMSSDVGATIRAARESRGWTLAQLGERVGCARSYLSLVETGRKPPPGDDLLRKIESELGLEGGSLLRLAYVQRMPEDLRAQEAERERKQQAARRLATLVGPRPGGEGALDRAHRSGELRRLVEALGGGEVSAVPIDLPIEVPLINKVAAGYPTDFTDLGYPARVADDYIRCPDLRDPDAFAARVVGDSMLPDYREGDIVIFSPARDVASGSDCFVRLEPDHESTFKRIYFEQGPQGREFIRMQPLNPAYPPRVLPREEIAGLYAAVRVMRTIG